MSYWSVVKAALVSVCFKKYPLVSVTHLTIEHQTYPVSRWEIMQDNVRFSYVSLPESSWTYMWVVLHMKLLHLHPFSHSWQCMEIMWDILDAFSSHSGSERCWVHVYVILRWLRQLNWQYLISLSKAFISIGDRNQKPALSSLLMITAPAAIRSTRSLLHKKVLGKEEKLREVFFMIWLRREK